MAETKSSIGGSPHERGNIPNKAASASRAAELSVWFCIFEKFWGFYLGSNNDAEIMILLIMQHPCIFPWIICASMPKLNDSTAPFSVKR